MPDNSHARNTIAAPPLAGADYGAILATIAATERGRWFLDEYAARHRGTDTEAVLTAIARVEAALQAQQTRQEAERTAATSASALEAVPADAVRHELAGAGEVVSSARAVLRAEAMRATEGAPPALESLRNLLDRLDGHLARMAELLRPGKAKGSGAVAATARADAVAAKEEHILAYYREPQQRFATAGGGLTPAAMTPAASAPDADAIGAPPPDEPMADEQAAAALNQADAMITDWAFDAAADSGDAVEPAALGPWPDQPESGADLWLEPPEAALERIEAREYTRLQQPEEAAAGPGEHPNGTEQPPDRPQPPQPEHLASLDDLMLQDWSGPTAELGSAAQSDPVALLLSSETAPSEAESARAAAESLLDIDLFELGSGRRARARPNSGLSRITAGGGRAGLHRTCGAISAAERSRSSRRKAAP